MKKLKLNLEDLKVESFRTSLEGTTQGTVLGQTNPGSVCVSECGSECASCETCDAFAGCDTGGTGGDTSTQGPSDPRCWCTANGCEDPTYINDTCNCADESRRGWESCGTTCQDNQTVCLCDTGTGQTGYATCTCQ